MWATLVAFGRGLWLVLGAPALVAGIYALTLMVTVPFGLVFDRSLSAPGDGRIADETKRDLPDLDWLDEVTSQARGLGATLTPSVIGVAAPLDNLSALLDGERRPLAAAIAAVGYGLLWCFLWGGVIHRFAVAGRRNLRTFFQTSRRYAPAMLRLGALAVAVYGLLFATVHAWMFGPLYEWLTRGEMLERTAFFWRVGLYIVFGTILMTVNLVVDYAKIDVVTEGRGSAISAARNALTFIRRVPTRVVLLAGINGLLFSALLVAYGAVEFVPGRSSPRIVPLLIMGQAYIVARLVLRLIGVASQVSLRRSGNSSE